MMTGTRKVDVLVKRLRDPAFGTEMTERNLMDKAADHIDALAAQLAEAKRAARYEANAVRQTIDQMKAEKARAEAAEAKLAKVEEDRDDALIALASARKELERYIGEAEAHMAQTQDRHDSGAGSTDLEKTVHEIVQRSNLKASLQPEAVRRAMSSYLEPEPSSPKPWESTGGTEVTSGR